MYAQQSAAIETDEGVNVVRVSRHGLPLIRFIPNRLRFRRALAQIHANRPIDVIEGGELDVTLAGRSSPGIKVLRMHGGPTFFQSPHRAQIFGERSSFRIADELCAVSRCVAEGTRRLLHLGGRHIEVIPNPVNVDLFAPALEDSEEGLIVFTGTITERKGIRQLLQAMPRIVAEVPLAHLEVYGGEAIDPPPPIPFTKVLTESMPPEIAQCVHWKGRVARSMLPSTLQRASVCVYPSHIEAMPIAWLEGLATGKAVVASETGPGHEIIDEGVTGLLCNPLDPSSIADKIIRLLKDSDLRKRLGAAARKMVVERYSLPMLVDRNIGYYQRIISESVRR